LRSIEKSGFNGTGWPVPYTMIKRYTMITFDEQIMVPKWYVLHTKCHHEKTAALRLEGKGFEPFVPLRPIVRKWKDRKKKIEFPIFPGYLFVKMPLVKKTAVLQTPGIVRIVGQGGRAEEVREDQIFALKTIVQEAFEYDPYPYLVPGIEVEVIRGPLKNVRGVLEEKRSKHRLIINLEMINNCVATEIDAEDVKPV
jgi:transcription termination/antitermination protein NusG